jgi:NTP pyrophosphatase (non-canonical NTP hydrolase)
MTREEFQTERTRIISEMLDNPDEYGIYPTTKCFEQLDALFDSLSLPPAEGAEAIVKKYEDEYDFKFHWVQRDRVIRMMREFAAQPQPKLDPKKVQWSGYGELGNISQKPLQPTAEGAEEILERAFNNGAIRRITYIPDIRGIISAMQEFATLHAQRIAEKMVAEDDLQKLMNDISEWSDKTFGNGQRNPAIIYHLKKEVEELIAAIEKTNAAGSDPSVGIGEFSRERTMTRAEYADCLMLLLDSAHHFGISARELLSVTRGKLEINKVRKWGKPDENGVIEHIE